MPTLSASLERRGIDLIVSHIDLELLFLRSDWLSPLLELLATLAPFCGAGLEATTCCGCWQASADPTWAYTPVPNFW